MTSLLNSLVYTMLFTTNYICLSNLHLLANKQLVPNQIESYSFRNSYLHHSEPITSTTDLEARTKRSSGSYIR